MLFLFSTDCAGVVWWAWAWVVVSAKRHIHLKSHIEALGYFSLIREIIVAVIGNFYLIYARCWFFVIGPSLSCKRDACSCLMGELALVCARIFVISGPNVESLKVALCASPDVSVVRFFAVSAGICVISGVLPRGCKAHSLWRRRSVFLFRGKGSFCLSACRCMQCWSHFQGSACIMAARMMPAWSVLLRKAQE